MDEITFSYKMTKDDYAEGNALLYRKFKARSTWIIALLGIALMAVPFLLQEPDGRRYLSLGWPLIPLGLILIYYGIRYQSPKRVARQQYASTGIEGHEFAAQVSQEGIQVRGTYSEWKYAWPAILLAEESEKLFALYSGLQIFVFAKRYLNEEQINALRSLIATQPKFAGGTIPKY
jgi:hypothetical protein